MGLRRKFYLSTGYNHIQFRTVPLKTVSQQEHEQVSRFTNRVYSLQYTKRILMAIIGTHIRPSTPKIFGINGDIRIVNFRNSRKKNLKIEKYLTHNK